MIRARAVGNAVFLDAPGGRGPVAAWGERDQGLAAFVAEQINAAMARNEAALLARWRAGPAEGGAP